MDEIVQPHCPSSPCLTPFLIPGSPTMQSSYVHQLSPPPPFLAAAAAAAVAAAPVPALAPAAAAAAHDDNRREVLAPFKSSLSGAALASFVAPALPSASLRLPLPERPLLDRGAPDNSSSHLSLVSIDPEATVLRPEVLHRLKMQYVHKGAGAPQVTPAAAAAQRQSRRKADSAAVDVPPPPMAPLRDGARKRKSQRSARDNDEGSFKRPKALALVSSASLLTLDKQLSREKKGAPSGASLELAAFALARHLVDWAADFVVDDEDDADEDEEVEEMELKAPVASAAAAAAPAAALALDGGSLSQLNPRPSSEWMARLSSEEHDVDFAASSFDPFTPSTAAGAPSSGAATPSFQPEFARDGSAQTDALLGIDDDDDEGESTQQEPALLRFDAPQPTDLDDGGVHAVPRALLWSPVLAPLLSPELAASSAMVAGAFLCLSPLASPKASPALLAHLASPTVRGEQLQLLPHLSLAEEGAAHAHASARLNLLAHTTTAEGAHVQLLHAGGW